MCVAYADLRREDIVEDFWKSPAGTAQQGYYEEEELGGPNFDNDKFPRPEVFWEHDQWWLRHDTGEKETTYSVVECQSQDGADYLDFEVISETEY